MTDAPTRTPRTRLLVPLTLLLALALTLAFAAPAAAEIKIGEATSAEEPAFPAEADLLKATAEYDVGRASK
ncbi:MAG TPA: hypothetical protein VGC32_11080 [Solirubrobacterales bacterium]